MRRTWPPQQQTYSLLLASRMMEEQLQRLEKEVAARGLQQ
jgi:hypothetical protein